MIGFLYDLYMTIANPEDHDGVTLGEVAWSLMEEEMSLQDHRKAMQECIRIYEAHPILIQGQEYIKDCSVVRNARV